MPYSPCDLMDDVTRALDIHIDTDTWPAAFCIALWLGTIAWGIGFIVRFI